MILCIDVGNTNLKFAVFDGDELKCSWRAATDLKRTSDEYGAHLIEMLAINHLSRADITGGIFSSVVPSLDYTIEHIFSVYLGIIPLAIAPGLKTGLKMKADNAKEVGADRIVNNVAAIKNYGNGKSMIVVDFGTATTFNVIDSECAFIGGVIAPGIKGSLDSLVSGTAKLPRVEIVAPKSVIATNTVTNMQAGIVFGFAGLVEYIVAKIKSELRTRDVLTIATGGFSETIAKETKCIDVIDKTLTLKGLKYLYYLNTEEK